MLGAHRSCEYINARMVGRQHQMGQTDAPCNGVFVIGKTQRRDSSLEDHIKECPAAAGEGQRTASLMEFDKAHGHQIFTLRLRRDTVQVLGPDVLTPAQKP